MKQKSHNQLSDDNFVFAKIYVHSYTSGVWRSMYFVFFLCTHESKLTIDSLISELAGVWNQKFWVKRARFKLFNVWFFGSAYPINLVFGDSSCHNIWLLIFMCAIDLPWFSLTNLYFYWLANWFPKIDMLSKLKIKYNILNSYRIHIHKFT